MKNNGTLFLMILSIAFVSCKKEGPGGTSSIQGIVMSSNHVDAEAEITEITFTNGLEVEHGDYFLLNSTNSDDYYYVWYDNPTWVTNGDPLLNGRTGIKVEFNYSNSNTEIADSTLSALGNYTNGNYTFQQINDVIILTNTGLGNVPDADKVTSPFEFNIANQGKDAQLNDALPYVDEQVYIKYGDNEYTNDDVRTGINGEFQFTGLAKGSYTVFVYSKDTLNGGVEQVSLSVDISANKSINDLGTFNIID